MCCPRCGSATRGRGGIPITRSRACGWTVTGSSATTPGPVRWCWSGTARLHRTADRLQSGGAVVLRERNEQSAPVRWVERHPVSEGRDQRLPATRRGHRQPRAHRHQGRTALHSDGPTRRDEGDQGPAGRRAAPGAGHRPVGTGNSADRPHISLRCGGGGAESGGGRVLRLGDPRGPPGGGRTRRAAGLRRPAVGQAVVPLRRETVAGR